MTPRAPCDTVTAYGSPDPGAERHRLEREDRPVHAHTAAELADATERRYVIDQLRRQLRGAGRPKGSPQEAKWRRDVAAANGDRVKLAARWHISRATVRQRLARLP